MLSILNKLTLKRELQNIMRQVMCFWTKSKNTTTTTKQEIKHKTLAGDGN